MSNEPKDWKEWLQHKAYNEEAVCLDEMIPGTMSDDHPKGATVWMALGHATKQKTQGHLRNHRYGCRDAEVPRAEWWESDDSNPLVLQGSGILNPEVKNSRGRPIIPTYVTFRAFTRLLQLAPGPAGAKFRNHLIRLEEARRQTARDLPRSSAREGLCEAHKASAGAYFYNEHGVAIRGHDAAGLAAARGAYFSSLTGTNHEGMRGRIREQGITMGKRETPWNAADAATLILGKRGEEGLSKELLDYEVLCKLGGIEPNFAHAGKEIGAARAETFHRLFNGRFTKTKWNGRRVMDFVVDRTRKMTSQRAHREMEKAKQMNLLQEGD